MTSDGCNANIRTDTLGTRFRANLYVLQRRFTEAMTYLRRLDIVTLLGLSLLYSI